jgi:glycosyltransferase involved in cell wall biosynthesis
MKLPLTSIIVVSHNQAAYIREALQSVFDQTYPKIEIIVVDDASTDQTVSIINAMEVQGFHFKKILLKENLGYCKAFNVGLARARGEYIIDLAADDMLLPNRVARGVSALHSNEAGVDFCDVYYIDASSEVTGTHFRRDADHRLLDQVPQGNIFKQVLERYFICAPGMMTSKKVRDQLGGYDQDLYYEDFDFWVRSSRYFSYHFTNEVLAKKRVLNNSMSKSQYLPGSKMLPSTLRVCQKAFELCQTPEEFGALAKRLKYELRQAILSNNYAVAVEMHKLLGKIENGSFLYKVAAWILTREWDFSFMAHFIRKAR